MSWLVLVGLLLPMAAQALSASSYIVVDGSGKVLLEKEADVQRPIASITKLFVAEQSVKLDQAERITIQREDVARGRMRSTPLKVGTDYSRHELTQLALVSSDNVAALALARSAPPNTQLATLVEGSGLDPENQSSARQLAEAARLLYTTEVGRLSIETQTEIGNRRSTNPLLTKAGWEFALSKTGFINSSGGCLVVVLKMGGDAHTFVILGSSNTKQRWTDLIELRRLVGDTGFYAPVKVTSVTKKKRHKSRS